MLGRSESLAGTGVLVGQSYSAHKEQFFAERIVTSTLVKSSPKLTSTQMKAVELLAKGFSKAMVAGACEVSTPTIANWLKLSQFKAALAEAINFKAESSNYKLHDLFHKALEECEGLMQDRNPTIRLGAARLVCESYSAIAKAAQEERLLSEMEARLEQVQANMNAGAHIIDTAEDADFKELPPAE